MLLYLLLGIASKSAAWPRVGKCARIELLIYPVPVDELWDGKGEVESLVYPVHVVPCRLFPLYCFHV